MLWNEIKEKLRHKLPVAVQHLWIEPISCRIADENRIELVCPDKFFCSWIKENYLKVIKESLGELGKSSVQIHFSVAAPLSSEQSQQLQESSDNREQLRLPAIPQAYSNIKNLHPRYTFEEFMVGESNLLAHSACQAGQLADLVAIDLTAAVRALGEITGQTASEDLVETIFGKFCIGK